MARGERLAIMGMSGSGKSVLLKIIAGTHFLDNGSLRVFDHEFTSLDHATLTQVRMRIGMVFQYGALISSLNVRGNLAFAMEESKEIIVAHKVESAFCLAQRLAILDQGRIII